MSKEQIQKHKASCTPLRNIDYTGVHELQLGTTKAPVPRYNFAKVNVKGLLLDSR